MLTPKSHPSKLLCIAGILYDIHKEVYFHPEHRNHLAPGLKEITEHYETRLEAMADELVTLALGERCLP